MEQRANKKNTIFVMAAEGSWPYDGLLSAGYRVCVAYKKTNLITRILREICFRLPFFPKKIWFKKDILRCTPDFIIIKDTLISRKYLLWLQQKFPTAQINFQYYNMVGKAKHLYPADIPEGIRIWTYDEYDSERYDIGLIKTAVYFPKYIKEKQQIKYDILFVGRDKGRGEMLLRLEKYLQEQGLITKFVIVADGRFAKKKKYYQKEVPYEQIVQWVSQSRSVINIAMKNQRGVTVRDLECLFNKAKLITTNKYITHAYFYNANNVFILENENWKELPEFIKIPYDDDNTVNWNYHSVDALMKEIVEE